MRPGIIPHELSKKKARQAYPAYARRLWEEAWKGGASARMYPRNEFAGCWKKRRKRGVLEGAKKKLTYSSEKKNDIAHGNSSSSFSRRHVFVAVY